MPILAGVKRKRCSMVIPVPALMKKRLARRCCAPPVLAFLSVLLLLPATAGARLHQVPVERGETVITYEGAGETDIPTGYQCVAIKKCRSFGRIAYRFIWDASVIVDRFDMIHRRDTTLDAGGHISIQPNEGLPAGAPPAKAPACTNSVRDRGHYDGGMTVTRTQQSVGVQAELPFSSKWLDGSNVQNGCQLAPDTWAGSVFSQGLDSSPQSDAYAAKLELAVRPKMGAPTSARQHDQGLRLHLRARHRNGPVRRLQKQHPVVHDDLQQLQTARHRQRPLSVVLRLSGPIDGSVRQVRSAPGQGLGRMSHLGRHATKAIVDRGVPVFANSEHLERTRVVAVAIVAA